MSSLLRVIVTPANVSITPTSQRPTAHSPPAKKQKMSLVQSYYLAYAARRKLLEEVVRDDHELRLLVGHANLLDGLMFDLANAEQEQEIRFSNTVESAANAPEEPKQSQRVLLTDHLIKAKDRAAEDRLYNEDSDSDLGDDEEIRIAIPVRSAGRPIQITITEDNDHEIGDNEFDCEVSITPEEDSIQRSLPSTRLFISEAQQRQAITTMSFCQPPSKRIDCSLSYPKDTSKSPPPPLGLKLGALFLMIRFKTQHLFSKQWKVIAKRVSEWPSIV